ncbi:GNAT family N-acetyltransferase [Enterococcus sp. LJL120]
MTQANITLTPVTTENIDQILALTVQKSQEGYVASTCKSLAYAYVMRDFVNPYGIYLAEELIGYVSIIFDEEDQMYNIWHFLIDGRFQGKGYGRLALLATLEIVREKAQGLTEILALSVEPDNQAAIHLYETAGFYKTGEIVEGESVMLFKLK